MSTLHTSSMPASSATPELVSQLESMLSELRQTRESVVEQIDSQISRASGLLRHLQETAPTQVLLARPPLLGLMQVPPKLTSVLLASPDQPGIDPELEQATLAELNEALSLAFTEIAGRGGMVK